MSQPADGNIASSAPAAAMTPEQLAAVQLARTRSTKIRWASRVAMVDAVVMAVFAFFCLACAPFDPLTGVPLSLAFALVTYNSFRGAFGLRRLDPAAPRLLAFNQILLAVAVTAYALFSLWQLASGRSDLLKLVVGNTASNAELAQAGIDVDEIVQTLTMAIYAVYISLIVGTVVAQGLTAWYYASRAALLRQYLQETPPWVVDLHRQTA